MSTFLHKNFGELTDLTHNDVLNKTKVDRFKPIRDRARIALSSFLEVHMHLTRSGCELIWDRFKTKLLVSSSLCDTR